MNRFKKPGLFLAVALAGILIGSAIGPAVGNAVEQAGWITGWLGKGSRRNTREFSITSGSSIGAANFVPGTDNTNALGTSSLRFSNVFSTLLNISGAATLSSTLAVTGPITASAGVGVINSTAPRTAAAITTLYGTYTIPAGTVFLNTTNTFLCHSTGTVQTSIVQSTSPTTPCS